MPVMIPIQNAVLGAAGSVYGARISQNTAGVGQQVLNTTFNAALKPGWYVIRCNTNQKIQIKRENDIDWDDVNAVNTTVTLYVDGRNVRVDQATAAQALTLWPIQLL